jgi:hypothetical protein
MEASAHLLDISKRKKRKPKSSKAMKDVLFKTKRNWWRSWIK